MPSINQWMLNQYVSVMVTTQWRLWYWIVPYLGSEKEETNLDGQYKNLLRRILWSRVHIVYEDHLYSTRASRNSILFAQKLGENFQQSALLVMRGTILNPVRRRLVEIMR